jgi:hypothetical protein
LLIGTPEELYALMLEAVLPEGIEIEDVSLLLEKLKGTQSGNRGQNLWFLSKPMPPRTILLYPNSS